MTSSARASSGGGIVRPRALAVFRLITSSNFVGCSIGYISRFGPLQNLVDEDSAPSPAVQKIRGIGHEAPSLDKDAIFIHGGEPVLDGKLRSLIRIGTEEKL